jgi:hypothetical protein
MPLDQGSAVNTLGLLFTLSMCAMLLVLPRRLALLPIAFITCYMTFGQQLVVAGLHFTMLRVVVLFGCARLVLRSELRDLKWLRMDTLVVLWVISGVTIYTLLWRSLDALTNRLGFAYDAVGLYFIFRFLIRDMDNIRSATKLFAITLLPLALCMMVEKSTGVDPFYALGGVPQFTVIREGVLRCQGPFSHPILAGTFGAVWLPLFVGLWWQGSGNRLAAVIGIISSTAITLLSGSSGPVATYMVGIVGLSLWSARNHMRTIRRGIVVFLLALQVVMKAPLWFVFAKIDIFSGSTGWHRANVIDRTFANFFDWWLLGTKDVGSWGIWAGDITNQYILEGVRGGLISVIFFVWIIVVAFSGLGLAMRAPNLDSPRHHRMLWALGSALLAHVIGFFSISYFDQNVVNWYLLLAMIGVCVTVYAPETQPKPQFAWSTAK